MRVVAGLREAGRNPAGVVDPGYKSDQTRSGATWIVGVRPLDLRRRLRVFSYQLNCRRCGWRTVCGPDDAVARLRLIGLLRREPDPGDDLVAELLVEAAPRMSCPTCKEKALSASPTDVGDDAPWQAAALCEVCRAPIPPERLEAVPDAKRCTACQGKAEAGQFPDAEPDYCPHCGALVELRVSRGSGITRYRRLCTGDSPCRL
jgi:Prokaryotic dksA/traR C4-type zinc finger